MKAMPAIFVGHGNPMNALDDNRYTRAWRAIGEGLPHPKAILSISAHWYVEGTPVTAMDWPRTVHDFGGFPDELSALRYDVPGDSRLARRVQELLAPVVEVTLDVKGWGLDHGTWAVLRHLYPAANVPVVQLGINDSKPAAFHYELGRRLRELRYEGVLVIGSGNLVHNLHSSAWGRLTIEPFDWAARFETGTRALIMTNDHQALIDCRSIIGQDAVLSVPTPEHYLPLLYVLGTQLPVDTVTFPVEGFDGGSVSMLGMQLG
jgi:4,5-DOPA dioxygenase extradiol